jgi:hypothetical protein
MIFGSSNTEASTRAMKLCPLCARTNFPCHQLLVMGTARATTKAAKSTERIFRGSETI